MSNILKSGEVDLSAWVNNSAIADVSNSALINGDGEFDEQKNFETMQAQDEKFREVFSKFSDRKPADQVK